MPRGNPQNFKPLSTDEARKRGRKGGKASVEVRRNYAGLKECFTHRMTPEMMEQAFDQLWSLFMNHNNLTAFDLLMKFTDEGDSVQKNITITFASEEMNEYGD